ncbi:hypothetical protein OGAPHI_000368 [Ogataea philodendri]|uniref:Sec1-like protein n=1 Tax=Ogataea philodendri TaxID=1378263 RepID=A0A9P8PG82_9ASCO|nr:uncharacterized protein OGAPHI_000368 [Ogataea philodendri]KAH3671663.1 hypothetical protein OGAPHI_000368 [Ogataea philodendri]
MKSCNEKIETIDFLSLNPLENRVYVTNSHYSIPALYNPQHFGPDLNEYQVDKTVESMMSVCILCNEYPIVRYYNSPVSRKIALLFQESLDEYYRKHPELSPTSFKTVFFITDRVMDLFAPFCHYKFYRSQIFDLMDTEIRKARGEYTYVYDYKIQTGDGLEKKHLVFDDEDPVYTKLEDLPIEEYTKTIIEEINELKATEAKYSNLKYASDLSHAALNQGDYLFARQLTTGHFELINKIDKLFREECILDLIVFENKCASNVNGTKEQYEPLTEELLELLANQKIDLGNKIRLLIVYAYYRGGIIEEDLRKLCFFGLPDKSKTESIVTLFKNFQYLGFWLLKPNLHEKPFKITSYFDVRNTQELTERYVPSLTNVVTRLAYGKLPEVYKEVYSKGSREDAPKDFPYVKGAPIDDDESDQAQYTAPVRNMPKWKSSKQQDANKDRIMLFVAGGLTHSELSTITSLEPKLNKNIFIGTDELYSTWDLIGDLRLINDDRKNFNFPLDEKFAKKKVPSHLYERSAAPSATKPPAPASTPGSAQSRVSSQASSSQKTGTTTSSAEHSRKRDKLFKKFKNFNI